MFSDLQPLMKAAFRMLREHYETEIEGCQSNIAKMQRTIKKHKSILTYFTSVEKELAKPPKPFKPPKMSKAMRKSLQSQPYTTGAPFASGYVATHHRKRK